MQLVMPRLRLRLRLRLLGVHARVRTLAPALLPALLLAGCVAATACAGRMGSGAEIAPERVTYRVTDGGRGAALNAYVFRADHPAGSPSTPAQRPSDDRGARRPVVLLLHGGGWSAGEPAWVFGQARQFAAAGMVSIAVQYRLSDSTHTPIDALEDVCAALQWTRAHADSLGVDSSRVAIYGVSAGGHLAGATVTIGCPAVDGAPAPRGADALALLSPALDVANDGHFGRLLLGRAAVADYSPVEHPRELMPPTMIVHGNRDTLTPLAGSQRFCVIVTVTGAPCNVRVYEGLGHLLTRDLEEQESRFDPDPLAREDGLQQQVAFLRALWPQ